MTLLQDVVLLAENSLRRARPKAGIIPYIIKNDVPLFLFMVSSDAMYGGADPAIAKGKMDKQENAKESAVREGSEELGLKKTNMKMDTLQLGWKGEVTGLDAVYDMSVFCVEVLDQHDFNQPDHEVSKVVWLTNQQFKSQGRDSHAHIVQAIHKLLVKQ